MVVYILIVTSTSSKIILINEEWNLNSEKAQQLIVINENNIDFNSALSRKISSFRLIIEGSKRILW